MTDAEKIDRVRALITRWALDDEQGGGAAIDLLGEVMNLLELDPWTEAESTVATSASGG